MTVVPQHRTLAQQLSGAFMVVGVLVGVACIVTVLTYGVSWVWLIPAFERSRLAVRAENAAFAAMLDEENGLRGYLMTSDERFLEAYVHGKAALHGANRDLIANLGSVPELAGQMVRMRLSQERFDERWANPAADTTPGRIPPSMTEGKELFDAYRRERALFANALVEYDELQFQRGLLAVALQVCVVLSVLSLVFFLALRQNRALSHSIIDPVAALLRQIARVRDGELQTTVEPSGPYELRQLGGGLNDMVHALGAAQAVASSRDRAIQEHSLQLRQIIEASREFSESLNLKYVVATVQATTAVVGNCTRVSVWLMDEARKLLVDSDERAAASGVAVATLEMGLGVAGRAAKSGRITLENDCQIVRFTSGHTGPVCAVAIPLIVGARVIGVLETRYAEPRKIEAELIGVLEMLASHAATAIESARLHEVVETRSHTDVLTRLQNRRRLDEDLSAECARCLRYERPLAFVMLDVDHFKAFNDTHGHPQSDTALQEVADVLLSCIRTTDTAYRYGGEEFCVLMRETNADDAMHFAERVRQRIEQRFATGPLAGITASFGVAGFLSEAPTPRELVEAADTAMYESKHAGRNRVALSSKPRPPAPSADLALVTT